MAEPCFSRRVFIKWVNDKIFHEPTSTWVLTASNGEFVDTRVDLKEDAKSWFVSGFEQAIETKAGYDCSIDFVYCIDSFKEWGKPLGSDAGHFKGINDDVWDKDLKHLFSAEDAVHFDKKHYRLEEGFMPNAECNNEIQDYKEIWDTLDPLNSTSESLKSLTEKAETKIKNQVFKLFDESGEKELGRYITIGKFGMGVALNSKKEYQAIRTYEGEPVYTFGKESSHIFACFIGGSLSSSPWKLTFADQ